jgi:hypothetical protein
MKLLATIFRILGVFLIVDAIVYHLFAHENVGLLLLLAVAGGSLLLGSYLIRDVHRAEQAQAAETQPGMVADDEPHVGPTIWPFVFALSMIGLVAGALGATWALVEGAILLVVALVGWALDVRRQWQHHHAPPADLEVSHEHP